MAKYQDFLYGQDTYGDRVRPEVPIEIANYGYFVDGAGNTVADVAVKVGPVSWEFPNNAKIAILRSSIYFPANPDRLNTDVLYDQATDKTVLLFHDESPVLENDESAPGRIFYFRSGDEQLGDVAPGSVLYISVYVSEPLTVEDPPNSNIFKTLWLPWDFRGKAWSVIPGDMGGVRSAVDGMPRGVMTGGLIYGEHNYSNQYHFMADVGYVLDQVLTDGELMVESPENIHPNMVLPLLRSFGMDYTEEAFFTDRVVNHRLKNILARYRTITMAKGSYQGLQEYVEAVTGFPTKVSGPFNLLLDRSDTCPDDPYNPPSNTLDDPYSVGVLGSADWVALPTQGFTEYVDSFWPGNKLHLWSDIWEDVWDSEVIPGANDRWDDIWGTQSFDTAPGPMEAILPPPLIPGSEDSGWDQRFPSPAVGWIHRLRVNTSAEFGSKQVNGAPNADYAAKVVSGQMLFFQMRYWTESACTVEVVLNWLDQEGNRIGSSQEVCPVPTTGVWNRVYINPILVPEGARYVSWQISVTGNTIISLGCISLSQTSGYVFRDPRSVAVVMDTGESSYVSGQVVMEDATAIMEDPNVTMEAREFNPHGDRATDPFEAVLINKLYGILHSYLPIQVQAQFITSDDREFSALWNAGVQYSEALI